MKDSFNQLLLSLSLYDLIYLIMSLLLFAIPQLSDTYKEVIYPWIFIFLYVSCTYQYKFVKTPFPCIWSNRDMSLFSFWPISPQFCIVKSTKASEKWSHMGEGLGKPLFHTLGMVFGAFLWIFCNEQVFSKAFLQHYLHFQFVKTPSHCKKVANSSGRCFDKLKMQEMLQKGL